MAAAANKQAQLTHLLNVLKKKVPGSPVEEGEPRPILEEVVYAILREGATPGQATVAYGKLKEAFFDWNEVRVSTVSEVSDAMHGLPDSGAKSQRIIELLQEIFEDLYAFNLDDIAKKGVKQAAKQLARYKSGVGDFTVAWVTQKSLGGHAVPIDGPSLRVLHRLGIVDPEQDELESIRGTVEHYIPKASGAEFTERLINFAATICTAERPACETCPMRPDCPFGQARLAKAKAAGKEKDAAKPKKKA